MFVPVKILTLILKRLPPTTLTVEERTWAIEYHTSIQMEVARTLRLSNNLIVLGLEGSFKLPSFHFIYIVVNGVRSKAMVLVANSRTVVPPMGSAHSRQEAASNQRTNWGAVLLGQS